MTPVFPPDRFGDFAHSQLAEDIFNFINDPLIVKKLEDFSAKRRPAVEAITNDIETNFGEQFRKLERKEGKRKTNRLKACVGKIVFDVLSERGWVKQRDKVRLSKSYGDFFVSGARYSKREGS